VLFNKELAFSMIRNFRKTILLCAVSGALGMAQGVALAATANIKGVLDWSSLGLPDSMTPASVTVPPSLLPGGPTLSSVAEAWAGYKDDAPEKEAFAINGADVNAMYPDSGRTLTGSYDSTSEQSVGDVNINNSGPGELSGYAGSYVERFFTAASSGRVEVSIDYSLDGNASTNMLGDYASIGFHVLMEAYDIDSFLATYNVEYATNGNDSEAAEDEANLVSQLASAEMFDWELLRCQDDAFCTRSPVDGEGGTLMVAFDVIAGTTYSIGAEITTYAYTDVNPVPVPAAAWLLGSALLGLVGVARRKRV
jgi:hypothetical protein